LQERWPAYLAHHFEDVLQQAGRPAAIAQARTAYAVPGPADLPLGQTEVRMYLDNLFLEGRLEPVVPEEVGLAGVAIGAGDWVAVGLRRDLAGDRRRRLEALADRVEQTLPAKDAPHRSWLELALRWAELVVLWNASVAPSESIGPPLRDLQARVDRAFGAWVEARYTGLHNQPPVPPVMVHHVARFLARHLEASRANRVALLVLDGLALDQWIALREVLRTQRPGWTYYQRALFTWAPTLTSVGRQAIFAGRTPAFFPESIAGTAREPELWRRFWQDAGLRPRHIGHAKGLGGPDDLPVVEALVSGPLLRALGLVVDKVDKIMHGMALGAAGMHNQVRQWAEQGFPAALIALLLDRGFQVFLTSDHGNIEAEGIGRPGEGRLPERDRLAADRPATRLPPAPRAQPLGLHSFGRAHGRARRNYP
jgi:hypothetical protein